MKGNCSIGTLTGPVAERDGATAYHRASCKKLTCKRCGPKKARRYREAIGTISNEKCLTRMMTLTLDPKTTTAEDSVTYLRKCFSKFRISLRRRFGQSISFIAVVELQKSGMAHLHVLLGVFIEQEWISRSWQSVGGGRIVDIRLVEVQRVQAYLSKYLTKEMLLAVPAKKKRISTSRDIRLVPKKDKASGWEWTPESIGALLDKLAGRPHRIISDVRHDDEGLRSFNVTWDFERQIFPERTSHD